MISYRVKGYQVTRLPSYQVTTYQVTELPLTRIIWGFSYSIFRLGYQLRVFTFSPSDYGKYLGYCLGVQRTGSFLVVTLGVLLTIKFGIFITFVGLFLLVFPALLISFLINNIDISKYSPNKVNWNLSYTDQNKNISNKIVLISFFKFTSSFTSNGLAIATITPFLLSINTSIYSKEVIIAIAGFIVGFRWIADIFFGIIFGTISDKFGRKMNIIISSILMLLAIIICISGINFYLSIITIVLMFFFSVSLETSLDALLGEISPENQKSSIVSRYSTWQDLGAALGPIIGFLFASNLGISLFEEDILIQQKEIEKMKNNPEIMKIYEEFPGVKIHSITNISETSEEKNFEKKLTKKGKIDG